MDTTKLYEILNETGFAKYTNNNIQVTKKDETQIIPPNDFLNEPRKYVEKVNLNLFLLTVTFIENDLKEFIEIILKKELDGKFYDSVINFLLSREKIDLDMLSIFYQKLDSELKEYTLSNCFSRDNDEIIEWAFNKMEKYIEMNKVMILMTAMNKTFMNRIIELDMFDENKNELYNLASKNLELLEIYEKEYLKHYQDSTFAEVDQDFILSSLINSIYTENKELCLKILQKITLTQDTIFSWLLMGLVHKKIEMIDYVFENGNIKSIDSDVMKVCIMMLNTQFNKEIIKYLSNNEKYFGKIDFKFDNHGIMRDALINNKKELVEELVESKIYSDITEFTTNELLNDAYELFATDECKEIIKKHIQ